MPTILVTNDDGITANGIRALVEVACELGDVLVVAPDSPQSAQGHAITIEIPIFLRETSVFDDLKNVRAYECSGTPVDCVKLAKSVLLRNQKADLCVSGINHGGNAAGNILYSGTMSAAMEAALEGVPSIGFSLLDFMPDADFDPTKVYARRLMRYALENGMPTGNLWNVNVPNLPLDQLLGLKICRQGDARWVEEYREAQDPRGRTYYWLTGRFVNEDKRPDTDIAALDAGYLSLVPCHHDLTDYAAYERLSEHRAELESPADPNAAAAVGQNGEQQLEQF